MSKEHDWEVDINPAWKNDSNYVAFKNIEEMLNNYYAGQWVAFVDGEMVLSEPDQDRLFKKLDQEFTHKSAYVHEIGKVYKIYSPRLTG